MYTIVNGQERDVESSTTEIIDDDLALVLIASSLLLVQYVGDNGGGGFVDNAEDVETGDDTSVLDDLSLRIVEVGGDDDDCVGDRPSERHGLRRSLSSFLEPWRRSL